MPDSKRAFQDLTPSCLTAGSTAATAAAAGLLCAALLLSGCAAVVGATHEAPIEDDQTGRSFGRTIDDEVLETKARVNIDRADPELDHAHIVVEAHNGIVLIAGQVPREALIGKAEASLSTLRGIRAIHNYLVVAGPTSVLARANDSVLSTRVNAALLADADVESSLFEVVTEDAVVYLLGVTTRDQADRAVDVVSRIGGVRKIVKVIEYAD